MHQPGLGCSRFARRYSGNRICFLFLQVLRWFTSLGFLLASYFTQKRISRFQRDGLPHSEIRGSTLACSSPQLIAAYHVLHRLPAPRHPPCALSSLTINYIMVRFVAGITHHLSIFKDLFLFFCKPDHRLDSQKNKSGGGKRIRTADPLLAKQVLFQLSYTPAESSSISGVLQPLIDVWWA